MNMLQILTFNIHGKIQKTVIKTRSLKYHLQHEVSNLIPRVDHISYQIF